MNYFGYMRISTKEERAKQRFTRQEVALEKYAEQTGIEYVILFREDESGKSFENRGEWKRLEKLAQKGDVIVFKDICRFTREALNGYDKYMELLDKGVELVFIDNPTVSTPYIKQLIHVAEKMDLVSRVNMENTIKLLLIVELDRAEKERLILSQRTKDGIAASSKKSGRKVGKVDKLTDDLKNDISAYLADRSVTGTEIMKKHGVSRNTFKKYVEIVKSEK